MALSNQAKKGPDLERNSKIAENTEQNSMCMSNISHSDVVNKEPFSAVLMKQQPSKGILKNSPSRADSISETHSDASMGDKKLAHESTCQITLSTQVERHQLSSSCV